MSWDVVDEKKETKDSLSVMLDPRIDASYRAQAQLMLDGTLSDSSWL